MKSEERDDYGDGDLYDEGEGELYIDEDSTEADIIEYGEDDPIPKKDTVYSIAKDRLPDTVYSVEKDRLAGAVHSEANDRLTDTVHSVAKNGLTDAVTSAAKNHPTDSVFCAANGRLASSTEHSIPKVNDRRQCNEIGTAQQDEPLDLSVPSKSPPQSFLKVRSDLMEPRLDEALDLRVTSTAKKDLPSPHRHSSSPGPHESKYRRVTYSPSESDVRDFHPASAHAGYQMLGSDQSFAHRLYVNRRQWPTSPPTRPKSPPPAPQRRKSYPPRVRLRILPAVQRREAGDEERTASKPTSGSSSVWNLTVKDLKEMLAPYVSYEDKKITCNVCNSKFVTKDKAYSHIENKHVDCFQYKCPLCRVTKTTRLAFDYHIRSRHDDGDSDKRRPVINPQIRLKRQFAIFEKSRSENKSKPKIKPASNPKDKKGKKSYDFRFLTFLRDELNSGPPLSYEEADRLLTYLSRQIKQSSSSSPSKSSSNSISSSPSPSDDGSSREGSVSPISVPVVTEDMPVVTWVSKEQGYIRINSKEILAQRWFQAQGLKTGTWDELEGEVLSIFKDRSIIKIVSDFPTVIQVFCVRQLLQ